MNERPTPSTPEALLPAIPNLRAFAISLCGNVVRADDLVQETLVKALANLNSFETGTNLKAWLYTILRNTYLSELRRGMREVRDVEGKHAARQVSPPEQPGHLDFHDLVKALDELPPQQREALILVGAEGLSYIEAARITGCAVGTVKSRVNRARQHLKERLDARAMDEFGPDAVAMAVQSPLLAGTETI